MRLLLLTGALSLSFFAYAQQDSFQLKNYKFRTPGFRALRLNLGLSGAVHNATDPNQTKFSSRGFNLGPFDIGYFRTSSSDRKLSQSGFSGYLTGSHAGTSYNKNKANSSSWSGGVNWHINNRFFKEGNWFFELGNLASVYSNSSSSKDSANNRHSKSYTFQDQLTLGFGKGRIEFVQDAQMALYILNDLQQQGLIQGNISNENAYAFAKLITDINNVRVFDFRKRRIYELTKIDSFLKSSGLSPTTDIRHFTTINDNWALAFNPTRFSGRHWFVRIKPGATYSLYDAEGKNSNANSNQTDKSFYYTLAPEIGYERQQPLSLQWQRSYGSSFSYETFQQRWQRTAIDNGAPRKSDTTVKRNFLNFRAFYGVGFFPNNRTLVYATAVMNVGRFALPAGAGSKVYLNYEPALNLNAQYFLSYRTYLNAECHVGYSSYSFTTGQAVPDNSRSFRSNVQLSLSHIIF